MRNYILSASALCLTAGGAHAGALDRTGQSIDVLFEEGRYIEFSVGYVSASVDGVARAPFGAGIKSGDIGVDNFNFGGAYKADLNDRFSYAVIVDQPYKAEVDYPTSPGYFGSDASAEFNSLAVTALLQYNVSNGFSVYGGLRFQETEAAAEIPFARSYSVEADADWGFGYVAGVAYERPDIALRVSLTYSSEISHKNDVSETIDVNPDPLVVTLQDFESVAEFETPQSINLAFQTGVAANTLVFGSIRWVDWSDFDLSPAVYASPGAIGQPLLSYVDDVITYTVGMGYRINDTWSVAGSVAYEENTGNLFTNLGPNDGQTSVGLAAIYSRGNMKITTGVRYAWIGDTTTAVQGVPAADFNNNNAVAFGVKVGYSF